MNCHAPAFIPRNSPTGAKPNAATGSLPQDIATSSKHVTPGATTNSPTRSLNQAAITGEEKINTVDRGKSGQELMVTTERLEYNATTNVEKPSSMDISSQHAEPYSTMTQQQQLTSNTSAIMQLGDRKAAATIQVEQQQIVTTNPVISAEERKLLDAMVSPHLVKPLNVVTCSTGHMSRRKNKLQNTEQSKTMVTNTQGQYALETIVIDQNVQQPVHLDIQSPNFENL